VGTPSTVGSVPGLESLPEPSEVERDVEGRRREHDGADVCLPAEAVEDVQLLGAGIDEPHVLHPVAEVQGSFPLQSRRRLLGESTSHTHGGGVVA
jgi:hypothetical protein